MGILQVMKKDIELLESDILKLIKSINKNRSKLLSLERQEPSRAVTKQITTLQGKIEENNDDLNTLNRSYVHEVKQHHDNLIKHEPLHKLVKIKDDHKKLSLELQKQKDKLSELAATYKYLDSKQYITPKTQKKKRETIENEIKELKEEVEVEKDNFEFLVYQNDLYRKLFDEFQRKIEANKKQNNEDLQKEKQKRKETANQKRSEIMKMRTYSLECTLWQEIEDAEVDLNKLKTKTGKNIIKSRYRHINGQTCKKVFSSMLLIVKTNRTKGKGDFKEKYNGKIIPVVLNDKNFKNLFDILSTDKHFVDKWRYRYLTSIDYNFIEIHNIDEKSNETTKFNPAINEIHDNINNYSIYFNYINYNLNENAKTFDELMNNARETDIENSCYVQLLYDTYKEPIAKRYKNDSQRSKFNENKLLTIEKICNICGIKYKQTNMGLSLEKSVQFFKTYKLGLKAIDLFGNIIKEYKPEKYNSRISPRTLYILIHNNHCYKLNCNIKSFEQLLLDVKRQQEEFEPSSKFPVYKEDTKIYKTTFINKLDDIVPHVISNKTMRTFDSYMRIQWKK